MKIAVTCENGEVFQHFGHTPGFAVFDVDEKTLYQLQPELSREAGISYVSRERFVRTLKQVAKRQNRWHRGLYSS